VNNLGEGWESFVTVGKVREKCRWWERRESAWKAIGNCFSKAAVQPCFGLGPTPIKNVVGVNQTLCYGFSFQPWTQ
jgi:hypothetical protein